MQNIASTSNTQHARPNPRWPHGAELFCELRGKDHGETQFLCQKTAYGFDVIQGICHWVAQKYTWNRRDYISGRPLGALENYVIMEIAWDPISGCKYRLTNLWHTTFGLGLWTNLSEVASKLSSEIAAARTMIRYLSKLAPMPIREMTVATLAAVQASFDRNTPESIRIACNIKFPERAPVQSVQPVAVVKPKPVAVSPVYVLGPVFNPFLNLKAQPTLPGRGRLYVKTPAVSRRMRNVNVSYTPHRASEDLNPFDRNWHLDIDALALVELHKAAARARFDRSKMNSGNRQVNFRSALPAEPYRPHMAMA